MSLLKFIFAMFLSYLPGMLGAIVAPMKTGGNLWYNTLNISVLTPAGWVFPVVCFIFYDWFGFVFYYANRKFTQNVR